MKSWPRKLFAAGDYRTVEELACLLQGIPSLSRTSLEYVIYLCIARGLSLVQTRLSTQRHAQLKSHRSSPRPITLQDTCTPIKQTVPK